MFIVCVCDTDGSLRLASMASGGQYDYTVLYCTDLQYVIEHLGFRHARQKMCHSPKVDDGVEFFFKFVFLTPI